MPSLQYLLLTEHEYADKDLRKLNNLVATLFRLENTHTPADLLEVVISLLQWLSDPGQATLRRAFTVWFARVLFPNRFDTEKQPILEELEEVKTMLADRVKEWNKESMERGIQKGIQKGMQEGIQKGVRQLLLGMLTKKFGIASSDIEQRLNDANDEQITEWSERILTAENIGDVFGH